MTQENAKVVARILGGTVGLDMNGIFCVKIPGTEGIIKIMDEGITVDTPTHQERFKFIKSVSICEPI